MTNSFLYCTYCSREKVEDPEPRRATERYLNARIGDVATRARRDSAAFAILSGKYGLLLPDDSVPFYDHLLQPDEVEELADRVAARLREIGAREVTFFTRPESTDPNVRPYRDAMARACELAAIPLRIEIL